MPYLNDRFGRHYMLTAFTPEPASVSLDRWGYVDPVIPHILKPNRTGSSYDWECPTRWIYNVYSEEYADLGNKKVVYEAAWKLPDFKLSGALHLYNRFGGEPFYTGETGKGFDHEYSATGPLTLEHTSASDYRLIYEKTRYGSNWNCAYWAACNDAGWGYSNNFGGKIPVAFNIELLNIAEALHPYCAGKSAYIIFQLACLNCRTVSPGDEGMRLLETEYRRATGGASVSSKVVFDSGLSESRADDWGAPLWHRDELTAQEKYYGASNILYYGLDINTVYNMNKAHGGSLTSFEKELVILLFAAGRLAYPRRPCFKMLVAVDP